jgi:hypothetical protein
MNKLTKKKLLIISITLLIINLLLTAILFNLDNSTYQHLGGGAIEPHSVELIKGVIIGLIISYPISSFLIGLIVAIFIDKNLPYSQRIIRSFLLTLSIFYGLITILALIKVIMLL